MFVGDLTYVNNEGVCHRMRGIFKVGSCSSWSRCQQEMLFSQKYDSAGSQDYSLNSEGWFVQTMMLNQGN